MTDLKRVLFIEFDGETPTAAVYQEDGQEVMRCSIRPALTGGVTQADVTPTRLLSLVEALGEELENNRVHLNSVDKAYDKLHDEALTMLRVSQDGSG